MKSHLACTANAVLFVLLSANVGTADEYLDADGQLAHPLTFESTANGGFAGFISNKYEFDVDGEWTLTSRIGQRPASTLTGKLDEQGLKQLDTLLTKHRLLELPEQIGFPKPVDSPIEVADGAASTIVVVFGEKQITAHTADGRQMAPEQQKMLSTLFRLQGELRRLTTAGGQQP